MSFNLTGTSASSTYGRLVQVIHGTPDSYYDGFGNLLDLGSGTASVGPQGATGSQGNVGPRGATGSGLSWMGTWDNMTIYYPTDLVLYNNGVYICLQPSSISNGTGIPPYPTPDIETSVWSIFATGGQQGATGPQGNPGVQGATGPQGNPGVQGATGPQGNPGVQGATGPQGNPGSTGPQGNQGNPGVQGATGPQGNPGVQGATGPQGNPGVQGATGPQGNQGNPGNPGVQGATGPQGFQGFQGRTGSNGATGSQGATGPQGNQGPAGFGGGGVTLYLNYIRDTSPTLSPLSVASISSITGTTVQAPTSETFTPTRNTHVSQLGLSPFLSDNQTTHTFTTRNSNTIDVLVDQFTIYKQDILPYINDNLMPPGIWELNAYAKADANNDVDNIGLRFWLIARTTGTSTWTNLIVNGSDISYLYDHITSQIITMSMYVGNPIDISGYDAFSIIITSRNRNSSSHSAEIYYQSSNTYSHLHTSFSKAITGATGSQGPIGPTGGVAGDGLFYFDRTLITYNSPPESNTGTGQFQCDGTDYDIEGTFTWGGIGNKNVNFYGSGDYTYFYPINKRLGDSKYYTSAKIIDLTTNDWAVIVWDSASIQEYIDGPQVLIMVGPVAVRVSYVGGIYGVQMKMVPGRVYRFVLLT